MMKMIRKGAPTYVVQCHKMEMLVSRLVSKEVPIVQELPLEVQKLIQKYKKVLQDLPMKMPPKRGIKHIIEVISGSSLVNIKPYRYSHHKKLKSKD